MKRHHVAAGILTLGVCIGLLARELSFSRAVGQNAEPVSLELDAMEVTAYQGFIASLDAEFEKGMQKLNAAYRARHPKTPAGRIEFVRGRGLFLVPDQVTAAPSASPAAVTSDTAPVTSRA